jgi:hypothetical protein
MLQTFMVYGAPSGATLNVQKSTGLFVGLWRNRTDSPLGFSGTDMAGSIQVSLFGTQLLGNSKTGHNWKLRSICTNPKGWTVP